MKRGFAGLDKTDISLSARVLIAKHGTKAETSALTRIMEMHEINNAAGVVAWNRIRAAIQEIQAEESSTHTTSSNHGTS